ncbi:MAG: hypothetical protein CM1200mP26_06210 [Acidimicrobiales bacterium]|nr:MAG: hypothetical protein CM1200mP26_06210 [Acidimicrobiales bacterium]
MISITDGQIFLQDDLFKSGVRPASTSDFSVARRFSCPGQGHEDAVGTLKSDLSSSANWSRSPPSVQTWTLCHRPNWIVATVSLNSSSRA